MGLFDFLKIDEERFKADQASLPKTQEEAIAMEEALKAKELQDEEDAHSDLIARQKDRMARQKEISNELVRDADAPSDLFNRVSKAYERKLGDEQIDSSEPSDLFSRVSQAYEKKLGGEDNTPYNSISNRTPSNSELVKSTIIKRKSGAPVAKPEGFENDPFMLDYTKNQTLLNDFRKNVTDANYAANMGAALTLATRGVNAPIDGSGLFKNINNQNSELMNAMDGDAERRRKVIDAIENRKTREQISKDRIEDRKLQRETNEANKFTQQEISINRNMGSLIGRFNSDPIIKPSEQNLASLSKSKAILDNKALPLTSQALSDAEQDIASALTLRGMGATEGKIKRTEMETLARDWAELKQKWGNKPVDLRKEAPHIVEQLKKVNDALIEDYKTTIKERKNAVIDEYSSVYGDSPRFQDRLSKLRDNTVNVQEKTIVKKQYSPSRNQTRIVFSDGSTEVLDGQK